MDIKTEYTIWMIPKGDVYNNLLVTMQQLSKKYGTLNFEPHVTLLGDIFLPQNEVLEKIRALTNLVHPFRVSLLGVNHSDHYFKCIFLDVEKSKQLMEAGEKSRHVFGHGTPYMPHMSLLYGNLDEATKIKIAEEVGTKYQDLKFDVDKLHLFSSVIDSSKPNERIFKKVEEFYLS